MNRKEKIELEVQKTLECFSHSERLKGNPFFYTRLKNRIDNSSTQKRKTIGWEFAWGVLKPILLLLIIVLNIFSATLFLKNRNSNYSSREQLLDALAKELALDSNQYNPNYLMNE
jgi:hypothetical protein